MSSCLACLWGNDPVAGAIRLNDINEVTLSTDRMGADCVIVKSKRRLCGTGAALANAPLVQDKSYFEVKIQTGGIWGVGLATPQTKLDNVPLGMDNHSWVLCSDGCIYHSGVKVAKVKDCPAEGDLVSCSYDHVELNFFLNGQSLHCPVTGIKGTVYPVLYVDDGAILDSTFRDFTYPPPDGYDRIMFEKSIL